MFIKTRRRNKIVWSENMLIKLMYPFSLLVFFLLSKLQTQLSSLISIYLTNTAFSNKYLKCIRYLKTLSCSEAILCTVGFQNNLLRVTSVQADFDKGWKCNRVGVVTHPILCFDLITLSFICYAL
jgi:hypothetical protein